MARMKALRKFEAGVARFRLEEVVIPDPGPDDVVVEIAYAGICGTDLHIYHDTYADAPPMTVGHEFSGVIVAVGSAVGGLHVGDRVVAETNQHYCGTCELCKAGRFCLCDERKALGQKTDGVFAEYALVRASNVHVLPDNVTMKDAALAEPLSCVVHAVMERSTVKASDVVLVTGPGPIGLLAAATAKLQGGRVVVAGTSQDAERLQLARDLGAEEAIDITTNNLPAYIDALTHGTGVDVVLECSGAPPAVNMGINALKKRGVFTQVGLFEVNVGTDLTLICYKEINYKGCLSKTNWSWRRTVQLMQQEALPLGALVSHVFPLGDWQQGFDVADRKEGIKVLLEPRPGKYA